MKNKTLDQRKKQITPPSARKTKLYPKEKQKVNYLPWGKHIISPPPKKIMLSPMKNIMSPLHTKNKNKLLHKENQKTNYFPWEKQIIPTPSLEKKTNYPLGKQK